MKRHGKTRSKTTKTHEVEGSVGTPGQGNYFRFNLTYSSKKRIIDVCFECHPCRIAKDIARRLIDLVRKKTLKKAGALTPEDLEKNVENVRQSKRYYFRMVIEALHDATSKACANHQILRPQI